MAVSAERRRLLLVAAAGLAGSLGVTGTNSGASAPVATGDEGSPTRSSGPVVLHGASPRLTIHMLDIHNGAAAAGLRVDLAKVEGDKLVPLGEFTMDEKGRTPEPALIGEAYQPGEYELLLYIGDYYREKAVELPSPSFLNLVPVRFRVASANERTHVPVQFGPWNYTCYHGS